MSRKNWQTSKCGRPAKMPSNWTKRGEETMNIPENETWPIRVRLPRRDCLRGKPSALVSAGVSAVEPACRDGRHNSIQPDDSAI